MTLLTASSAAASRLTTLIVAELVAVVVQYVTAYKFVGGAIDVMQRGVSAPPIEDLSRYAPSPLSWPRAFPSEILSLTERQLDILVTLGTNTALTRAALSEVGTASRPFNMLSAQGVRDSLAHDMGLLAEAFDEFAPARQLQFPGQSPEPASVMLRRLIKP